MLFTMSHPCTLCPFRKDVTPYLRKGRVLEIVNALTNGGVFPCHETVDHNDDGKQVDSLTENFCAGALIMIEKKGDGPNQMMRICERLGMYNHTKLKMNSPVYDSFGEMIAKGL